MKPAPVKFSSYRTGIVELKKGINENVSSLELEAGELLDCKNYMITEGGYGGYRSIPGYERIDGVVTPSEFISLVFTIKDCERAILDGDLITGVTSSATASCIEDSVLISGSYIDGDAEIRVEALIATGTFISGESLSIPAGDVGEIKILSMIAGGNSTTHAALDWARQQVTEVPGQGPILGLHEYKGLVYAFRRKEAPDDSEIGLYVEDGTLGWDEIDTSADVIDYSSDGHIFRFTNYNFFATTGAGTYSMFWVDGVNQTRYYNPTDGVLTIDNTGMSSGGLDAPTHISAHNYHLFLGYRGGSLQFSKLGDPTNWDGTVGASEIGLGDEITALIAGVSSSLIVFLQEGIRVLHGNTIDDFVLEVFSDTSGAFARTARRLLGTVFFVDDRGLSTLEAVDTFGDYAANSISQRFKNTLQNPNNSISVCTVSRDLNQYRIFFNDKQGIYVSFEGKEFKGATLVEFPKVVATVAQGQDVNKKDLIVFSDNEDSGYVYKMDSGTSFDGSSITCRLSTAFYHYGSPRNFKAFKRATFEIAGEPDQQFDIKVDFDYNELGNTRTIWYTPMIYNIEGGAVYSESLWGIMKYGTGVAATNRVPIYLQGIGTNMSYKIISNETYRQQHIIQNIITDYELIGRRT